MNVEMVMDLPIPDVVGRVVLVCAGAYAGVWQCHAQTLPSQWTGSYTASLEWRGVYTPEARALAEAFDMANSARYWAGLGNSRRAVWPGPSAAADAILEAAMAARH